jgi:LEA14-like dessication related protein
MNAIGRSIVLLVGTVSLSACQRIQKPAIELTGIRLAGIGLRGATFMAELSVDNPNDFAIEADSITYKFEASNPSGPETWTRVASGTSREHQRVEAGARTTVAVPIEFRYEDLSGPVRAILDKGTFNYRVSGDVLLRKPHRLKVPFSHTGHLAMAG